MERICACTFDNIDEGGWVEHDLLKGIKWYVHLLVDIPLKRLTMVKLDKTGQAAAHELILE